MFPCAKKSSKYFLDYKHNEGVTPLCVFHPQRERDRGVGGGVGDGGGGSESKSQVRPFWNKNARQVARLT